MEINVVFCLRIIWWYKMWSVGVEVRWLLNYGEFSLVKGFSCLSYYWKSKDLEKDIFYKFLDK